MFNPDPDLIARLSPLIERVLIVDPYEATAKTASDLLRALGAWRVEISDASRRAFTMAGEFHPHLILTEFEGPGIDGPGFTRALRRSSFNCRRSPVIVVSGHAKASSIAASRDAGAHEFLRKPFSAEDLKRRVENVAVKTRPWVEAVAYVGPDRRRFNSGGYAGTKRRDADHAADRGESEQARFAQALAILHAAVKAYDHDPRQANQALRAQIEILSALALSLNHPRLVRSVAALDRYLITASHASSGRMLQALLEDGANPLNDLAEAGGDLAARPARERTAA